MLVINSIEKTRLSADSYSYSGTGVAWKARLVLFLGFALMAGGLAGSVVRTPARCGTRSNSVGMSCSYVVGGAGAQICGSGIWLPGAVLRHCQRSRQRTHNAEVLTVPSSNIERIRLLIIVQLRCPLGVAEYGR